LIRSWLEVIRPPISFLTVLAMAERMGATGKDTILAVALGFEIAARVAAATPPAMQFVGKEKKFRYTRREGYAKTNFGAAAGAGKTPRARFQAND